MAGKDCSSCRYFNDIGGPIGLCRRFPLFQNRSAAEWCGEYKSVDQRLKRYKEAKDDKAPA